MSSLVTLIDAQLPQTQCTKCGFAGCLPYAQAIAASEADIDRCPPGGDSGIAKLAALLHRPVVPLDTRRGHAGPLRVAVIDERHCIGCTLCIQACPVDAIVGANKFMHTVVPSLCTGCDLCVAPCPVDCIDMQEVQPERVWSASDAADARRRYTQRQRRLLQAPGDLTPGLAAAAAASSPDAIAAPDAGADRKRAMVEAALARARARRAS